MFKTIRYVLSSIALTFEFRPFSWGLTASAHSGEWQYVDAYVRVGPFAVYFDVERLYDINDDTPPEAPLAAEDDENE